jgi:hypothetical protein
MARSASGVGRHTALGSRARARERRRHIVGAVVERDRQFVSLAILTSLHDRASHDAVSHERLHTCMYSFADTLLNALVYGPA